MNILKSSLNDLQKRGFACRENINSLRKLSQTELMESLNAPDPVIRTASAANLNALCACVADELLKRLCIEKCLYTKIAICERLEKGDAATANKMTSYLGKIGANQHRQLPAKISAKKSFPLPRDIIARTLGKMDTSILPVILRVLKNGDTAKISEALDAAGHMVFYHPVLATSENAGHIFELISRCNDNQLLLWKCMMCLSAFPLQKSIDCLQEYACTASIIGLEAKKSLQTLAARGK